MTDRNHTQTPTPEQIQAALEWFEETTLWELGHNEHLSPDGARRFRAMGRALAAEVRRLRTPAQEPRALGGYRALLTREEWIAMDEIACDNKAYTKKYEGAKDSVPMEKAMVLLRALLRVNESNNEAHRTAHPLAVQGGITEGEREAMRFYGNEPVFYSDKEKEKHDAIRFGFTLAACVRRLSPATTATGAERLAAMSISELQREFRLDYANAVRLRDAIRPPPAPSHPRGEGA